MRLRVSRAAGMLLVLLLHGVAVWLVARSLANREPAQAQAQRWTVVRLSLPPAVQPAAERRAAAAVRHVQTRPAIAAAIAAAHEPVSPGEASDGDATAAQPALGVGAATAGGTLGAPAAAALVLLPSKEVLRGALANPAIRDPRANTPRPSAEERMAMAIDSTLCVREERLPDGSVRRWMGHLRRTASAIEARTGHRGIDVGVCE